MARIASSRLPMFLIAAVFGLIAAACGGGTETASVEETATADSAEETTETTTTTEPTTTEPTEDEAVEAEPADAEPAEEATEAPVEEDAAEPAETESTDSGLFGGDFIDLNGESIDLASFEGQDVVLWFWAPW